MKKRITVAKVAGTYIGTVVGAGFASGQEILQFFVVFGRKGLWGLLTVTFLFILFGYIAMELGYILKADNHLPVVRKTGGCILGAFSDIIITFFLFGALTAMIAGSGALFAQEFKLHPLVGSLFMALISIATVMGGFQGTVDSISFVVPFLILAAIGLSIASLFVTPVAAVAKELPRSGFLRNWLWSAILYTSYNSVTAISILAPLGREANDLKVLRKGALLGGLGLGLGGLAIFIALYVNSASVVNLEVPMIFVAGRISPAIKLLYAVVLLAEIYTTAVSDLYGFTARICPKEKSKDFVIILTTATAFLLSLAGFSNLVRYLYPAVGYCGVLTLMSLIYHKFKP